jgi:hypothetical protein
MDRPLGQLEAERRYHDKNRKKRNRDSTQFFKDNPDYKKVRRQEIRTYVAIRKLTLGCSICGYKEHPAALDWHHTDDNKESIVGLCDSISAADREMEKCIVMCANCHRVHHAEQNIHQFAAPVFDNGPSLLD